MAKSVDTFINEALDLYKLKNINTTERRDLKFKLKMADIQDIVQPGDTTLALDIILGSVPNKPIKGSIKTASLDFRGVGGFGACPRCSSHLARAKLNDLREVGYCETCHIAVTGDYSQNG